MLHGNPDARPTCGGENNNRNAPSRKILLVPKICVGGHKYLESLLFGGTQ